MTQYCSPKLPFIVWDGTNLAKVLDFFSLWEDPDITASGDELHVNGIYPMDHVFPPGTVFVGSGSPQFLTPEEFESGFDVIAPPTT